MGANKLKINCSKSQAININQKLRSPTSDLGLNYGLHYIQPPEKRRYLGVTIDHKLTFLPHVINLKAKLSRNVGVLFKLNKYLPTFALITLYYALVQPFLFDAISVWGSTNKSFFIKLRSLQNKASKAIGHLGWHASP